MSHHLGNLPKGAALLPAQPCRWDQSAGSSHGPQCSAHSPWWSSRRATASAQTFWDQPKLLEASGPAWMEQRSLSRPQLSCRRGAFPGQVLMVTTIKTSVIY